MRSEHGQGTVEYLAVVLLVAAVVGAAAALVVATGIGDQVVAAFRRALCIVTGGACDEADRPCVRVSRQHSDGGHVNVLVARIGSRDIELREQRADGTVAVTLIDEKSAGIDGGTGVEAHVRWGTSSWAVGTELRAAVLAGRASGRTWIARDDAEATRLVAQARLADLSRRPEATIPATDYYSPYPPMRPEVHVRDPDVTFSESTGGLELDLRPGSRVGSVHLEGGEAYGVRIDHASGRRTVYVRNTASGRGGVSVRRVGVSAAGEGEERYGITFDRSGRPIDLEVLATLDVEGTASLPPALSRIAGFLKIPLHGSKHVETEQHLDLTEPASAEIAQSFLGGFGDDALAVRLTAKALRDRLERVGTTAVRTYAASASAHAVGGHAMVGGIGIGGEVGSEDSEAQLLSAAFRGLDGAWRADPACLPVT